MWWFQNRCAFIFSIFLIAVYFELILLLIYNSRFHPYFQATAHFDHISSTKVQIISQKKMCRDFKHKLYDLHETHYFAFHKAIYFENSHINSGTISKLSNRKISNATLQLNTNSNLPIQFERKSNSFSGRSQQTISYD